MNVATATRTDRPKISDIFCDPYDPERSFWIHTELTKDLKECFMEADELLAADKIRLTKKPVEMIASYLPQEVRDRYLRRLTYNYHYLCPYEPRIRKYNVSEELKHQFMPEQKVQETYQNVELPAALDELMQGTRRETRRLYGIDILRSEVSVRYASHRLESPFQCDAPSDVSSRLLSAMHFDEKKGITSIIYLTDVDESTGCFSYLDGSHLLKQSLTIRTFHETLANDLNVKSSEDARRYDIPEELYGTLDYGQNLPAHKREIAKRHIVKVVGPMGTAISFTGNTMIHGGGWPSAGQRVAMFVAHIGLIGHRAQYLIPYFLHFKFAA